MHSPNTLHIGCVLVHFWSYPHAIESEREILADPLFKPIPKENEGLRDEGLEPPTNAV